MSATPDLFIPDDNPYAEADRGLFMARDLNLGNGDIADVFCRIGLVDIYNFQGSPNYCIIGYKVYYWRELPTTEADYAAFTVWKYPSNNVDTFYYTAHPQAFNTFLVEGYCIDDFVRNVRGTDPALWTTRKGAYAKYSAEKDVFWTLDETPYAVNNIMHQTRFSSPAGLPLVAPTHTLRYRGYVMEGPTTPDAQWVYKSNQFIYVDHSFVSRSDMIGQAQQHFVLEGGRESAMRMLGITQ